MKSADPWATYLSSGFSSQTRGVHMAGGTPTRGNVIDYVTIASTGNANEFGNPQTLVAVNHNGKEQISHDLTAFEKILNLWVFARFTLDLSPLY